MGDITKLSVVSLIIDKHKISWIEFATHYNVVNGSGSAELLGNIIQELEQDNIIIRLPPPIAWQVIDLNKAIVEKAKLTEESGNDIVLNKKSLKINKQMRTIAITAIIASIILAALKC